MGLRFVCPSTGHKIEAALEVDDEKLLLIRKEDLQTPCSFCGDSQVGICPTMRRKER